MTGLPDDEWTMICPPGRMEEAETLAELRPENIREIAESPLADSQFILINDSQLARYRETLAAAPVCLSAPPRGYFAPPLVLNEPLALIQVTGI